MTNARLTYPVAIRDSDNAPYLDGWKKGKLMIQYCENCKKHVFFPRPMCPHCWSNHLKWVQASGEAEIVSFSVVNRLNHPSFKNEVPIVLAEIKLKENVNMLARILTADAHSVHSGMNVSLISNKDIVDKHPLPVFQINTD